MIDTATTLVAKAKQINKPNKSCLSRPFLFAILCLFCKQVKTTEVTWESELQTFKLGKVVRYQQNTTFLVNFFNI